MPDDGRQRVVIDAVRPEVDGGRFPVKRIAGDRVAVEADIIVDGHDQIAAILRWRRRNDADATGASTPMTPTVNDVWTAEFPLEEPGDYEFTVEAWVDHFGSWRRDLKKKADAGQDVSVDFLVGAALVEATIESLEPANRDRGALESFLKLLRQTRDADERVYAAEDERLLSLMRRHAPRRHAARLGRWVPVRADREKARFSAWYELFPRSASPEPGRHGTLRDVEGWLPRLRRMGFDVLYLPPIHPIGRINRKGRNNAKAAEPGDVGSPWAIGSDEGGHKSIHPALGTLDDFDHLVSTAQEHGVELALDVAFQCAPDHPYVKEHPEWFKHRPDGTIQYAENPPKKYEDIYPFDFETDAWESLWIELKSVFEFWIGHGVRIFRVDNPHTKALPFWEWCLNAIHAERPDVIFLSEAFTRPKMMYRLAKLGFSQSYTYFAWRNTAWEIEQYLTELTRPPVVDFFRPNLWPNTPDILTEYLQTGGRPAAMIRLILAATLSSNYGVYGPPLELYESTPRHLGSEEYLDSEKYQIREWNLDRPDSLADLMTRLNRIRRQNPALHDNRTLRFHRVDNGAIVCYSKSAPSGGNEIVTVVNTNPHRTESGTVDLDLGALGLPWDASYQAHDLLTGARYRWHGPRNYVELNPGVTPAHVLRLEARSGRDERDFETFM